MKGFNDLYFENCFERSKQQNKLLKPLPLGLNKPVFIYQNLLNSLIFYFYIL
ncbi:hypothetical protein [uncultured Gammaproteobacteria bacterium]|nr:hypothetical protein [uncultured Gammaproteobacteria bacterium]